MRIRIKEQRVLRHQANLGEEIEEVSLPAGQELTVLQEWDTAWLAKDDQGQLFNVKKEWAEEA